MVRSENPSVLIVESNPQIANRIFRVLQSAGFAGRLVLSCGEALSIAAEANPPFAIVGDGVPGMTGIELAEQIGVHSPATYVTLVSSATETPNLLRVVSVSDFLASPFTDGELAEHMHVAANKRAQGLRSYNSRPDHSARLATRQRELVDGLVKTLQKALEVTHPETHAHSERVALRSAILASAMGASIDQVRGIYMAGLLHDLGKIAVSPTLLAKPGALEPEEMEEIKTHPEMSERIVSSAALPAETLAAIRHHHEWYDGGGYPDGLSGVGIPYGARVIAVCDAFDAMISDRPYRRAVEPEEALNRLNQGSATQFDPAVVEAFCRLPQVQSLS